MAFIDLRSDTVTNPTDKMREAMFKAEVGDDVYGDDPTMKELEQYAAELCGKEAAIFVPSGTFGNQLALFTHCNRGDEVILADDCHIVAHEVGASSVIAGVQLRTLNSVKGMIDPMEVKRKIRKASDDIHYPGTSLICVENAHSSGRVIPLTKMESIYNIAKENDISVHLDGARLFNASAYLKVKPSEICGYADSIMFCLSKGLCAPVGSILAGNNEFISKAKKNRKLMGGGLRQSGILAAAGLVALKEMINQPIVDHENAKYLANELSKIPGITVNDDIHINMVFFNMQDTNYSSCKLVEEFYSKKVKINGEENGEMRFVTNYWVSKKDIDYVIKTFKEILDVD
ncbi:low-specificity L-threonine aldolase [Clostridium grantii]|uniref:L-threonine aldolase n=1 Tax=Clostridium grantii DSM 8605 TaxID=1121316 RepID=A0A1M5QQ84_9CLOT|nr:low-specificity L-threonine aldolase [Clostridium grantii]SHH16264.1 L-threonine aldolase [Clostridium grantii DSM 8605]